MGQNSVARELPGEPVAMIACRRVGDIASVTGGGLEMFTGGSAATAGVVACAGVVTCFGGASVAAGGVALALHGGGMVVQGTWRFVSAIAQSCTASNGSGDGSSRLSPTPPTPAPTVPLYEDDLRPPGGPGGNGVPSTFGSLHGNSRQTVDKFLRSLNPKSIKVTKGGYTHYKYPDGSEIVIRPDGEIIRLSAPRYEPNGARINKGARLDQNGHPTQSHNTGEKVIN